MKNEIHATIDPIEFTLEPFGSFDSVLKINQLDYESVALDAEFVLLRKL